MKNKKIVIIRPNVALFGLVGTYNVQEIGLANALKKMGHDVTVLYCNRNVSEVTKSEIYDYVYYLPHKHIGLHGMFNVNLIDEYHPDTLILFSDNQLWAKNIILYCKKNSIKCIHYFGNVLSDNPAWLHQAYTKVILWRNRKSYDFSINVAKTNKVKHEMLEHGIHCRKVINIGLDSELLQDCTNPDINIRHDLGIKDDEFVLLFVGRLIDYKRPIMACDILLELQRRGIKGKLFIIGDGKLANELESYIEEKKLSSVVNWQKRVPYDEMYKYMVSCDCCINLSPKEIFGMTVLEAMYYGAVIVAHEAPGPNDIIDNNISGYLCNFDDVSSWADKIIESQKYRTVMSKEAKKRVRENFLWDRIAGQFMAL